MKAPMTFAELLVYLANYPDVRMVSDNPKVTNQGLRRFVRYADGLMWFQSHLGGPESHLPIECGMTAGESGLEFHPTYFVFTKFGVATHVHYVPGPDLQRAPTG